MKVKIRKALWSPWEHKS